MKNVHLLPTDKPSELFYIDKKLYYIPEQKGRDNWDKFLVKLQNIYITNNEEINFQDYFYDGDGEICKYTEDYVSDPNDFPENKKIVLTTDTDLIANGVQSIDDEFLEWFVKNPSCEYVEVRKIEDELISHKNPKIRFNALQDPPSFISAESLNNMILTYKYKIIIPKE